MKQGQHLPALDGLEYKAQRFLDSGSKMSEILLAVDRKKRPVILKIACVDQRARAEVNRQAIQTTIDWLQRLGVYAGIIRLRPIAFKGASRLRAWFTPPTYSATLQEWPGQPEFLVMDYLPGGSLRDFVGDKRLDIELALWIAHHIARALAYIHERSCVHRDIKPENILFRVLPTAGANTEQTLPILIDFGVAARIGEAKLVSGSRLWMAPELQEAYERHPLPVDPAWDIYALGLILCYMLTGRRPRQKNYDFYSYELFREQTLAVLDREAAAAEGPKQAVIPPLKQLIDRTLAKDPQTRPSAAEFVAETGLLLSASGRPLPTREQDNSLPFAHRRRLGMVAMLIVAIALLLGIGSALRTVTSSPVSTNTRAVTDASTLAVATPTMTQPAPTRVPFTPAVIQPPPTRVSLTPTPAATAAQPLSNDTNTRTAAGGLPASVPMSATLPVTVQLLAPATEIVSSQTSVDFVWTLNRQSLRADDCFALVFWDPSQAMIKMAPRGVSKATRVKVDFEALLDGPDASFRQLLQSSQRFNWGVRIVSCASPTKILSEAEEVRVYTYAAQ